MEQTTYDVKRLDHLGLVAGFCKEIGALFHHDRFVRHEVYLIFYG